MLNDCKSDQFPLIKYLHPLSPILFLTIFLFYYKGLAVAALGFWGYSGTNIQDLLASNFLLLIFIVTQHKYLQKRPLIVTQVLATLIWKIIIALVEE